MNKHIKKRYQQSVESYQHFMIWQGLWNTKTRPRTNSLIHRILTSRWAVRTIAPYNLEETLAVTLSKALPAQMGKIRSKRTKWVKNPLLQIPLIQAFLFRADDRTHLGSLCFPPREDNFLNFQCQVDAPIKELTFWIWWLQKGKIKPGQGHSKE